MRTLTAILLGLISLSALAESVQVNRDSNAAKAFCENRTKDSTAIQSLISQYNNQLYFINGGGLFGGGVCWWHSRFTRAAAYLAVFDPSLPKPSDEEAKIIVKRLRDRKGITLIPGFNNLYEFSVAHGSKIQDKLNDWQRSDGIQKFSWASGLSGSTEVEADQLSLKMDELFERVSRGEVVYQMLQMPGVVAHAWLVTGMKKTEDGYKLTVVDSNTGTETYIFRNGMTQFDYHGYWQFVPYTKQTGEERKLNTKLVEFCSGVKPDNHEPETNPEDE